MVSLATMELYYQDSGLFNFTAKLLAWQPSADGWGCRLDRSAFYPGGGGQPPDRGWINGIELQKIVSSNGEQWHYLSRAIENPAAGLVVSCQIDEEQRHDYLQQHTGQHLISALLFQQGINTIAIRLGSSLVSIETTGHHLNEDELLAVENQANRLIGQHHSVRGYFPSDVQLSQLQLRRQAKVSERIRVVEIGDIDCTPCGGLHCSDLSGVVAVRYHSSDKIRGHQRTHWLVGNRVAANHHSCLRTLRILTEQLSAPAESLVAKLQELKQLWQSNGQQQRLTERMLAEFWQQQTSTQRLLFAREPTGKFGCCQQELQRCFAGGQQQFWPISLNICHDWAELQVKKENSALLFWQSSTGCWRWFCITTDLQLIADLQHYLSSLGGKGGGKLPLWQGVLPASCQKSDLLGLASVPACAAFFCLADY